MTIVPYPHPCGLSFSVSHLAGRPTHTLPTLDHFTFHSPAAVLFSACSPSPYRYPHILLHTTPPCGWARCCMTRVAHHTALGHNAGFALDNVVCHTGYFAAFAAACLLPPAWCAGFAGSTGTGLPVCHDSHARPTRYTAPPGLVLQPSTTPSHCMRTHTLHALPLPRALPSRYHTWTSASGALPPTFCPLCPYLYTATTRYTAAYLCLATRLFTCRLRYGCPTSTSSAFCACRSLPSTARALSAPRITPNATQRLTPRSSHLPAFQHDYPIPCRLCCNTTLTP